MTQVSVQKLRSRFFLEIIGDVFVLYRFCVEFEHFELEVEYRAREQCDEDCSYAKESAEQITNNECNRLVDEFHHADGEFEFFRQDDHQPVSWARAKSLRHIQPDAEVENHHADEQKQNTHDVIFAWGDDVQTVDKIDIQSDHHHIQQRADADARADKILKNYQRNRDQNHRTSDRDPKRERNSAGEHVPWTVSCLRT